MSVALADPNAWWAFWGGVGLGMFPGAWIAYVAANLSTRLGIVAYHEVRRWRRWRRLRPLIRELQRGRR